MRAVIFDMDGVIVDSEPVYDFQTLDYLRSLGVEATEELFAEFRGMGPVSFWEVLVKRFALPHPVDYYTKVNTMRLDEAMRTASGLKAIEGVPEVLDELAHQQMPLALASSSFAKRIDIILGRLGLGAYFPVRVSGDEASRTKPDPEIFLLAAHRLDVLPKDCVVIEDSAHGVEAAARAGMRCVGFSATNQDHASCALADAVITRIGDLMPVLHDWGL